MTKTASEARPGAGALSVVRRVALLGVVLLVSACAIAPKAGPSCSFKRYQLETSMPAPQTFDIVPRAVATDSPRTLTDPDSVSFATVVEDALNHRARTTLRGGGLGGGGDDAMLFLSGGSLHGAFGAGYLDEWKRTSPTGKLPKFAVVTGISTGALISTFALIDRPDLAAEAYGIKDESELLTPLVTVRKGEPTIGGYIGLFRQGALADLAPLRIKLAGLLDDAVLTDVARAADEQRRLLIGVVDVDTGGAVAIDLTAMAQRWRDAGNADPVARATAKACYVEAIIASSSAPMAAQPVFIDNRMYVDGGARFGAFSDELGPILERRSVRLGGRGPLVTKTRIYLIVNGTQTTPSKCGRANRAECLPPDDEEPATAKLGPHAKWKFLSLALRSESILSNQVYRFSAESIGNIAKSRGGLALYSQIEPDSEDFTFDLDPSLGGGSMTCRKARAIDRARDDPIQFFPRYMHCLVAYGRAKLIRERPLWKLP